MILPGCVIFLPRGGLAKYSNGVNDWFYETPQHTNKPTQKEVAADGVIKCGGGGWCFSFGAFTKAQILCVVVVAVRRWRFN